jgi:plasmid stability protein
MTTLQIRQMPQPLHDLLVQRAAAFHRSLTQQAIADLSQALGSGDAKSLRLAALRSIRAAHANQAGAVAIDAQLLSTWLSAWQREDRQR